MTPKAHQRLTELAAVVLLAFAAGAAVVGVVMLLR